MEKRGILMPRFCRWGKWCATLRSAAALQFLRRRSCASVGCGSSRVAASGGQGGIGGLRVPPTPSLDSLLTPLYRRRSAMGMEAARRCALARRSAAGAMVYAALRSAVALRVVWCILAPLLAAAAALWQPPAAKEGQGDCDFSAPHCALTRPVFRAAARQPHSSRATRDLRGPSYPPLETPPLR